MMSLFFSVCLILFRWLIFGCESFVTLLYAGVVSLFATSKCQKIRKIDKNG